jgi:hypothetical protein
MIERDFTLFMMENLEQLQVLHAELSAKGELEPEEDRFGNRNEDAVVRNAMKMVAIVEATDSYQASKKRLEAPEGAN